MTLNVAHARASGGFQMFQSSKKARTHLRGIADVITREQPDIVAFQELDSNSFWNGRFNHGEFLAEKTQFDNWFLGSHQLNRILDYGTGLMSRYELSDRQSITFRKPFARTKKGFVLSTIDWPEVKNVRVDLVSVHLDFLSHDERERELETLTKTLSSRNNLRIIMGDFNMEYQARHNLLPNLAARLDLHAWNPYSEELVTFPKMGTRLDWVLVSQEFEFLNHKVIEDVVSDHHAVIVEVTLLKEKAADPVQVRDKEMSEAY